MLQPGLKKSLGQHFLINPGICQRIAALLCLTEIDQVLEIGPGGGSLTRFLAPHKRLLLLEKDSYWARERSQEAEVLEIDALKFDWESLSGKWKLAGNLPYNIASPLIWEIVSRCANYRLAVFMVQKEVGARICASPGTRSYGALSVWVQCHARPRLEFTVAPGSFRPPPKVDSAVISLEPMKDLPAEPGYLKRLLDLCFQSRRKQLKGILRNLPFLMDELARRGLAPELRPENLSPQDFMALSLAWARTAGAR